MKEGQTPVAIETPQIPRPPSPPNGGRAGICYAQHATSANVMPACMPFHDLRFIKPPNKTLLKSSLLK